MNRRTLLSLPFALQAQTLLKLETIGAFGHNWRVPIASDWRVSRESGGEILDLLVARPQQANPRRPFQYALLDGEPLSRLTLEVEVQRVPTKSAGLILVYAWRDAGHFNYVHLCEDSGRQQPVHNGVFHCFGGDRVRISSLDGPGTLPTADWHQVKLTYDASAGLVECWVNGQTSPSMKGVDLSLGAGLIGLGSFFHTGRFRNFRLTRG